ncbi:hypothetical protein SAMN05428951_1128 [Pseudomonas sp. OV546]|nr:hypothetical protein SAMN05428951_1128 [Pseudomonas sp. OV546]
MQTTIRAATQDDVDTLFTIRTSVVQNHLSVAQMAGLGITPQGLADSIRAAPCAWIAEVNGQPAAFSMVDLATGDDVRYEKSRAP